MTTPNWRADVGNIAAPLPTPGDLTPPQYGTSMHWPYCRIACCTGCLPPLPDRIDQPDPGAPALGIPARPARRERLAELDALTDQIQPLIDRLDAIWRALETDLGWRRRAVP